MGKAGAHHLLGELCSSYDQRGMCQKRLFCFRTDQKYICKNPLKNDKIFQTGRINPI